MVAGVETIHHRKRSIRTIALCVAVGAVEGFDIQAAGVAAPKLGPMLHLTPHQMGLFFASANVGMMVGAVLGGFIADRYGRRFGLALSLAVFGAFTYATASVWNFEVLCMIRFLTGLGLGGTLSSLVATAAEAVEPRRRGTAVGFVYAAVPLGGAIASATSMGFEDWQSLFLLGAVLPFLLLPFVIILLPSSEPNRAAHRMNDEVKPAGGILDRENRVATLLLWISFFLLALVLFLLMNWLPVLLVSKGFTGRSASAILTAFSLSAAAASIVAGLISDTYHRRLAVVVSVCLLLCSLYYFAVLPPYLPLAMLAGTALGAGVASCQSILYGLAPQIYQHHVRGTGVGLAVGMARLGSIVGPLLAGISIASGRTVTEVLIEIMPIAFAGGLASFLLVTVLERRRSRPNLSRPDAELQAEDGLIRTTKRQRSI